MTTTPIVAIHTGFTTSYLLAGAERRKRFPVMAGHCFCIDELSAPIAQRAFFATYFLRVREP
jgi:hypothetical protein